MINVYYELYKQGLNIAYLFLHHAVNNTGKNDDEINAEHCEHCKSIGAELADFVIDLIDGDNDEPKEAIQKKPAVKKSAKSKK